MKRFKEIFKVDKPVIGMIHIDALPGTPKYCGSVKFIIDKVLKEAEIYSKAGIDSIAIENMHDLPYLKCTVGPEIVAMMSIIGYEIKNRTGLPCGIQILAGANKEALAAAHSSGIDFIRVESFVFAHVADEGYIEASAAELLRYRKQIGAENILIFTDVKKKHSSHSITADVNIIEAAKAAEFFLSDGVVITGTTTGKEADFIEVESVKNELSIPVLIGSGITYENLDKYFKIADGFIVGSHFKRDGFWENELEGNRVENFMDKVNNMRKGEKR